MSNWFIVLLSFSMVNCKFLCILLKSDNVWPILVCIFMEYDNVIYISRTAKNVMLCDADVDFIVF
jgi:hypothetical protein